jgi:signal transduction histidine kinase
VLLLLSEPWLTPRLYPARGRLRAWYPVLYLVVQIALITALEVMEPHPDFIPVLFIPLSMQVVRWFGRRNGLAWIGVFAVLSMGLLALEWQDELPSRLASGLMYGGSCFLIGSHTLRTRQARAARQENERLFGELQAAHRQLQDYAAQVETLAVAEERGRLARDLHDSVTQTLFSMNLSVQSARTLLDRDPAKAAGQLDRLQELARGAVAEIQTLVSELRPRTLAEEGLAGALRRHLAERQAHDGLQVELAVVGPERTDLPEEVVTGLYRIAQEALNNVVKHAGTQEAFIRLDLGGTPPCIEVVDHGAGFAPGVAASAGHVGLAGMAERARRIGWRLTVDARPGQGTRIHVEEGR